MIGISTSIRVSYDVKRSPKQKNWEGGKSRRRKGKAKGRASRDRKRKARKEEEEGKGNEEQEWGSVIPRTVRMPHSTYRLRRRLRNYIFLSSKIAKISTHAYHSSCKKQLE